MTLATRVGSAGLRRRPNIIASYWRAGRDRIIPFRMERVPLYVDCGHLGVADLDPLRIASCIEFAAHRQAGLRCRRGD